MGGSNGGSSVPGKTLGQLENERKDTEEKERYESEVNKQIKELLQDLNDRDNGGINKHLDTLKKALEKDMEGFIDLKFGGSVSKHTYADGLSDIDMLVQINNSELANKNPEAVLSHFKDKLQNRFPNSDISVGKLAVTIKYSSGHEIQLLPSIKTETGYRIARPGLHKWSNVINPKKFAEKLTSVNQKNGNKVVPTIKLLKNINASLPEQKQLSGYHIESLAIDAFKNTPSSISYKGMVEHFCRHAEKAVLKPIKDSTGQSVHVDDYLGNSNSTSRQRASHTFKQIIKRIESANSSNSLSPWNKLLGKE